MTTTPQPVGSLDDLKAALASSTAVSPPAPSPAAPQPAPPPQAPETNPTTPADPEPPVQASTEDPAETQIEGDFDPDDPPAEGDEGEEALPELVLVEFNGRQFQVPKEMSVALMKDADYTRKTQQLADDRRQLEEREQRLETENDKALEEAITADRAQLDSLSVALQNYDQQDWDTLFKTNPDAKAHWDKFQGYRRQYAQLFQRHGANAQEFQGRQQRREERRLDALEQKLTREIDGWSKQTADAITRYAIDKGYTKEQLRGLNGNLHAIKSLHAAWQADQQLQPGHAAPVVTGAPAPAPGQTAMPVPPQQPASIKPLQTVSQKRTRPPASNNPSDRDSDDVWMRKRRKQVADRNRAA
ncbi:MAG: hypothetical protein GY788_02025 [bacterium]|nr:hypothetical protein [bacterium]